MSRRREVLLADEQWEKVKHFTPRVENPKVGRPRVDDRSCFEGILWVLKSGARCKDLPERFPSPSTCWRRLVKWDDAGVFLEMWHAFIDELSEQGRMSWDELFIDGSFASAKKGRRRRKPQRGKGTKWMVVADGTGIPLACSKHSAERTEVKLAAEAVDQVCSPEVATPLIADKGYDSDDLRDELAAKNLLIISPHRQNRKRPSRQDGRRMRRYSRRWIVERTISWIGQFRWLCATNTTVGSIKLLYT